MQMNEAIEIVNTTPMAVGGVWPDEENDFTPWLANHLDYLDVLGMGRLTCKGTEVSVAGKSLDILAGLDGDRLVVIENQYGKANHDHLKRGLEYALAKEAIALVLIAQQFPLAFISDSLPSRANVRRAELMPVFLVSLRVEMLVGKDLPYRIPRLDVVEPRPIEWPPVTLPIPTITLPEFLGAVTASALPTVKALFETWRELPGCGIEAGAGNKSMGLWLADGTFMVMGVDVPSGRLWIYRSAIRRYLASVASLDEDTQVDKAIGRWFPSATQKPQFLRVENPTPASVRGFGRWLVGESAGRS
jgi:hypothetical protein